MGAACCETITGEAVLILDRFGVVSINRTMIGREDDKGSSLVVGVPIRMASVINPVRCNSKEYELNTEKNLDFFLRASMTKLSGYP